MERTWTLGGHAGSAILVALVAAVCLVDPLSPAEIVVEGGCTLVDAIHAANNDAATGGCPAGSGADEITLTGDVVLTSAADGDSGLPQFLSEITLRGSGFEIRRDPVAPDFRLIATDDHDFIGSIVIENVTLSGGSLPSGAGGAIWFNSVFSDLVLTNVTVSGNTANVGGGLSVSNGYVDLVDSLVVNNQATSGGGIIKPYGGYLGLQSTTVANNVAAGGFGGGLSTSGGFDFFGRPGYSYIYDSTFSGNSATYDGGGISAFGGLRLTNSTVSGNYSETSAGGLSTFSSRYEPNTIRYSTITGNTTGSGTVGGFYDTSRYEDSIVVRSSIVSGNSGANCLFADELPAFEGFNFDDDSSCHPSWRAMTGLDPNLELNGGLTATHALSADSSAVNAVVPCSRATDQRGLGRNDGACDSGAFELNAGPLTLVGTCPGPVTAMATSATPNTVMELFLGPDEGSSQVLSGVCAGTELGITNPISFGSFATDSNGDGSLTLDLVGGDCGQFLQGVTEADCATTNLASTDACELLAFSHTGGGADPVSLPTNSPGCPTSTYSPGEIISLTASADAAWDVGSWAGTDDDNSTSDMNTVTMPDGAHAVAVNYVLVCETLNLGKSGSGSIPLASPTASPSCPPSTYTPGDLIQFSGATPDPDWTIGSWTGTDDDGSTDSSNSVVMPDGALNVRVNYVRICADLRLSRTGAGANLRVSPDNSPGCGDGLYEAGELIDVVALPDPGWAVESWTGTDDDASTSATNTITMPLGQHEVGVAYAPICSPLTTEHSGMGIDPIATPLPNGVWEFSELVGIATEFLSVGDIDGDLDPDIVAESSVDGTVWVENSAGDASSWDMHIVSDIASSRGLPVDLDGDGDADIATISFTDDRMGWFENTSGDGSSWTSHVVTMALDAPIGLRAADLDGDGDSDLLTAALNSTDPVVWWENSSGDGLTWTEHILSETLQDAWSVAAADIDDDGDLDVLAGGDEVLWFENLAGDGSTWVERTVAVGLDGTRETVAADLDGDSDLDILVPEQHRDRISWYENVAGDGSQWTFHLLVLGFDVSAVSVTDIDSDTDVDVVALANNRWVWFENVSGSGLDWIEDDIGSDNLARAVATGDMNGDGGADVLGSGFDIDLWTNMYGGNCAASEFGFDDGLSLTAAPDPGWEVAGWSGTLDDASTGLTNRAVMPDSDHTVGVDYVESASMRPTVSITGECPGAIDVAVVDAAPNGNVVFYVGNSAGTTVLGGGACVGTELDLGPARRWKKLTADASGEATFSFTASSGWCTRSVQAVDGVCSTSNVQDMP